MSVGNKYSAACACPLASAARRLDDSAISWNVISRSVGGKGCSLWAAHTTWRPGLSSASLNGPKPTSWLLIQRFAQGSPVVACLFAQFGVDHRAPERAHGEQQVRTGLRQFHPDG